MSIHSSFFNVAIATKCVIYNCIFLVAIRYQFLFLMVIILFHSTWWHLDSSLCSHQPCWISFLIDPTLLGSIFFLMVVVVMKYQTFLSPRNIKTTNNAQKAKVSQQPVIVTIYCIIVCSGMHHIYTYVVWCKVRKYLSALTSVEYPYSFWATIASVTHVSNTSYWYFTCHETTVHIHITISHRQMASEIWWHDFRAVTYLRLCLKLTHKAGPVSTWCVGLLNYYCN